MLARYLYRLEPTQRVTAVTALLDGKTYLRTKPSLEEMTMNENVPYIWRVNYRNNLAQPEKILEIAHRKAQEFLSRAATGAFLIGSH